MIRDEVSFQEDRCQPEQGAGRSGPPDRDLSEGGGDKKVSDPDANSVLQQAWKLMKEFGDEYTPYLELLIAGILAGRDKGTPSCSGDAGLTQKMPSKRPPRNCRKQQD